MLQFFMLHAVIIVTISVFVFRGQTTLAVVT